MHPHERPSVVVLSAADGVWIERAEGIRTRYLVSPAEGSTAFLTGITEFDPNRGLPLHLHNCQESVVILEGMARFEADQERFLLQVGDTTMMEPGVVHRFENTGTARLRILWIYGSSTATRTLVATGETVTIGSVDDRLW